MSSRSAAQAGTTASGPKAVGLLSGDRLEEAVDRGHVVNGKLRPQSGNSTYRRFGSAVASQPVGL